MTHEMSDTARKLVEWGAYLFAGVTAVSFSQAAFVATTLAGLASFLLACIRIHDRWKYGPAKGRE